jgi:hypothetical protein
VWEPVDGECIADTKSARKVALVATVVVQGWADIPAGDAVGSHAWALVGREVDNYASARWGERASIEIKVAVETGVGGEFWLASRGTEEIEGDVGLWHQEIPFGDREFGVTSGEARAKMIFPGLDSALGGVAAMDVRWYELEVDVVFFESSFYFIGAFVIEDVERRSIAIGLQAVVEAGPSSGELAGLACFEGLGEDGVTVIIVKDHDVIVST